MPGGPPGKLTEAARIAYTRLPTPAELEASGFTLADYEETAEVWPENWPAVDLLLMCKTQWRTGINGPTGLDYPVVFALLDKQDLSGDDWRQMFDDIRLMENAALNAMHED